jgi:hypothetical protein
MNLVNRGFIFVRPNKPFIKWAKEIDTDLVMDANAEGSIYLIEEEFWDDELILKQYAKKIASQEFSSITEDDSTWPKWTELAQFEAFFSIEMGCTCIDLLKEPLQKEAF